MTIQNFTLKKESPLYKAYSLNIEDAQVRDRIKRIATMKQPLYKLNGFRKGKAPLEMVVSKMLDNQESYLDAKNDILVEQVHIISEKEKIDYIDLSVNYEDETHISIIFWINPNLEEIIKKEITQYKVAFTDEDRNDFARKRLIPLFSDETLERNIVQEGDVVQVEHNIHIYDYMASKIQILTVTKKILATKDHWSINKHLEEEITSLVQESILEDIGPAYVARYLFNAKVSKVKNIFKANEEYDKKHVPSAEEELKNEIDLYISMVAQREIFALLSGDLYLDFPQDQYFKDTYANIVSQIHYYLNILKGDIEAKCKEKFKVSLDELHHIVAEFCKQKSFIKHMMMIYASYIDGKFNQNKYNQVTKNFTIEDEIYGAGVIAQMFQYKTQEVSYQEMVQIIEKNNLQDELIRILMGENK